MVVTGGVDMVVVHAGGLDGDLLFHAVGPQGSSVAASSAVDGDTVALRLDVKGDGPRVVDVALAIDVVWEVRLEGGASDESVDMSKGRLGRLELTAGASRVEVTLPAPTGTMTVLEGGGASSLVVHAPAATLLRVGAGGGAGSVTMDGVRHVGVSGGSEFKPTGWDQATDRIDIDCTAGVSDVVVDRTS